MYGVAMMLMFNVALALFIGLGPIFIICLLFDKTKPLFEKWLLYGIGTLFTMAMLSFISGIVLRVTLSVAEGFWGASAINGLLGSNSAGLSTQALEQGAIGLVLTMLIISTPPMAGRFFSAALGTFMPYSAFGGGGGNRYAPQGQPPMASGVPPAATPPVSVPHSSLHAYRTAASPQADTIKALSEARLAAAINTDPAYLTASVGAPAPGTGVPVPPQATTTDWAPLSPAAEHLRSEWASQQQLIQQGIQSRNPAAQAAAVKLAEDLRAQQMGRLSDAVYDPDGQPPPGWTSVGNEPQALAAYGLKPEDFNVPGHHFGAQLYEPDPAVFGDAMKPVLAFRGTDIKNWDDIANDIAQGRNQYSADYERAVHMGTKLLKSGKAGGIDMTGHSLGGGLASAASEASGASATTFNAAGLNVHTVTRYGGTVHPTPISAYRVEGEVLTSTQENRHWLTDPSGAVLSSILPHAMGTPLPLPASSFDRIRRHMMSDVNAGIDKAVEQDHDKLSKMLGNDW